MTECRPLPSGWSWAKLGDVAEIRSDLVDPRDYPDAPHIAPNHIESGTGRLLPYSTVAEDGVISPKHRFTAGQILYSKIRPYLAKAIVAEFSGLCSADMYPISTELEPAYLHRWLISEEFTQKTSRHQSRTVLPKINQEALLELPLPVPPAREQLRIAKRLPSLLTSSEKLRESIASIRPLLDQYRLCVLRVAFSGALTEHWRRVHPANEPAKELLGRIRKERKLRWEEAELKRMSAKGWLPEDDRWKARYQEPEAVDSSVFPELPQSWEWARWEQIGFSENGRAFPSEEYTTSGIKLLRPGNLDPSGELAWTTANTCFLDEQWAVKYPGYLIGPGDLIMNLTAQSLKDEFLGRVCLAGEGERCLLNQRLARLSPVHVSPRFCLWLFKSPMVRGYIDELNKGSLIQHMFTSQVADFALPIPPLPEQEEIIRRIEASMSFIARIEENLGAVRSQLLDFDRAIVAKAFRGELVPQDPNDEPAAVLLERIQAERKDGTAQERGRSGRPRRKASRNS